MYNRLIKFLEHHSEYSAKIEQCFREIEIPAKTILLHEGEVSQNIYFIRKGCLRVWFNSDGKDISFQFFFEGQAVSSFESFLGRKPSMFSIESLEPCSLITIHHKDFKRLIDDIPELKNHFFEIIVGRLSNYANLFLSRIKNNPKKRYDELIENQPEIVQRVPQHYIASYLGITPISLSRIRNRK